MSIQWSKTDKGTKFCIVLNLITYSLLLFTLILKLLSP